MNDLERLAKLKAALEIAQLAEVNIELTTDELDWLIARVVADQTAKRLLEILVDNEITRGKALQAAQELLEISIRHERADENHQ